MKCVIDLSLNPDNLPNSISSADLVSAEESPTNRIEYSNRLKTHNVGLTGQQATNALRIAYTLPVIRNLRKSASHFWTFLRILQKFFELSRAKPY